ncbi:MAG: hypothetical protein ABH829_01515 [archaeon]
MRCALLITALLLLTASASAAASEFLIEKDLGTFKFIKSSEGLGLTGESYTASYRHEIAFRGEVQESTTYKVEVEVPKYRDPQSIFNASDAALRRTGSVNYKLVIGGSDTLMWPSGNYLVRITYKHGSYFPSRLLNAYSSKYPSEAPTPEYIRKFEVPEYNSTDDIQYAEGCGIVSKRIRGYYCSNMGRFERQRDPGDFCLEGYECRSTRCVDQLCTSPYGIVGKLFALASYL